MISRNLTMISSEGEQWARYNLPRDGKWPFIVDFPINNGDFPLQTVSSPEGKTMLSPDARYNLSRFI